uniref:Uncharacterized protein n=1 Tax=Pyxicephalus adspersus TaxID=30357 RepID=A0AAV2ZL48_PYXAD|nr:TPA: hypothetical protein GDO54_004117 [Pyxicephalus adspersus]
MFMISELSFISAQISVLIGCHFSKKPMKCVLLVGRWKKSIGLYRAQTQCTCDQWESQSPARNDWHLQRQQELSQTDCESQNEK